MTFLEPAKSWSVFIQGFLILAFTYFGYRAPSFEVESKKKQNRAMIEDDLPSVLDLLVVMMDSGANFDTALSRLLSEKHFENRPIKAELVTLATELSLTPNREAAFRKLAYATQIDNFRLFTSTLIQSELYGTPVSTGLRALAFDIRQKKFHQIETKSGAIGPKLTIPMTLFFLPAIFIVVLAPTLIKVLKLP
jgi:tight adherence protein C